MAPRLYQIAPDTPSPSPPPPPPTVDVDKSGDGPSISWDRKYIPYGSDSSSSSFVDEEPLDKVVASLVSARKVLVPTPDPEPAPPRRRLHKKRRLLDGVDADEEPSEYSASSDDGSSSSSGIPTPDVGADADTEEYEAPRHTLTRMPHPVLPRYSRYNERDAYVDSSNPSPPSPDTVPPIYLDDMSPAKVHNPATIVELDESPKARGHDAATLVELLDSEPAHLQPRMTATDLDDLFGNQDPNSPPPPAAAVNNAEAQSPPLSLLLSHDEPPPAEAMMEADAWRPAVLSEAKMAYDHFARNMGVDAEYACAVMPVPALLRVMECVGTLLGAAYSTDRGPTGEHVDLRRAPNAGELPDTEVFEEIVNKTLNAIIVQDVIEREKVKQQEGKASAAAKRAEQEQKRLSAKKRPGVASDADTRRQASPAVSRRKRVAPCDEVGLENGTPNVVGPNVSYRSRSVASSRSRTPVISFDDDSPPDSPPPRRAAAIQAVRAISPTPISSSSDESPRRRNTRSHALKQRRIYEKEEAKMLGPNANIDDLRRHSYKMQIRADKFRKKRQATRKLRRVFASPNNSTANLVEEVPLTRRTEDQATQPWDLDQEDEIEAQPVTPSRRNRRRLAHTINISDDEVEIQPVQQFTSPKQAARRVFPITPPKRSKVQPVLSFTSPMRAGKGTSPPEPRLETPPSYLAVINGVPGDLEWGEMGDNFTVLGKRPRSELKTSPVARAPQTPFSFAEYWQNEMQNASLQRVRALPERPRLRSEFTAGASTEGPSMIVEGHSAARLEDERLEQQIERRKIELQKIKLQKQLRESKSKSKAAAAKARAQASVSAAPDGVGGRVSKRNGRKKMQQSKSGGSNSIGGLTRKQMKLLREKEQDYREKEDPRHPEYVPRAKQQQQQLELQRQGHERMEARWANELQGHPQVQATTATATAAVQPEMTTAAGSSQDHRAQWEAHQERLRLQRQARVEMQGQVQQRKAQTQQPWAESSPGGNGQRGSTTREERRRSDGRRGERERRGECGRNSTVRERRAESRAESRRDDTTRRERHGESRREHAQRSRRAEPRRRSGRRETGGSGSRNKDALQAAPIGASNKGFAMLERMGWKEGEGLGAGRRGRTSPVAAARRGNRSGLG